jgi:hypothetical protein
VGKDRHKALDRNEDATTRQVAGTLEQHRRAVELATARVELKTKRQELRIARVNFATRVVLLIAAIIAVASAIVALLTAFVRLQVGHDRERAHDAHPPAEKGVVVLVADQARTNFLRSSGAILFQPLTCSWSMQRRVCRSLRSFDA